MGGTEEELGIGKKGKGRKSERVDDPGSVNGMHCGSDVNQVGSINGVPGSSWHWISDLLVHDGVTGWVFFVMSPGWRANLKYDCTRSRGANGDGPGGRGGGIHRSWASLFSGLRSRGRVDEEH